MPSFSFPTYKMPSFSFPTNLISPIFADTQSKIQELQDEITKLRKEVIDSQKKGAKIEEQQKTIAALEKKERLSYLLPRVNISARQKLLESDEFREMFENADVCNMAILSVDIRRSTELMLKARKPQLYADFISNLCSDLTRIILDNFGVFDKFTGDGILAFFPEFYTGEDLLYLTLKAAEECLETFAIHYRQSRNCFTTVLNDVGLGIGIDYGQAQIVRLQDGITVIGTPVVYACRLSAARAGQILLNQPAYEITSEKFGKYANFHESELDIKHEGRILTYTTTLNDRTHQIILPQWFEPPPPTES